MVSILAIGAHPDDIEFGCSATLMRHKKHGCKIHLLVLTKGEASGDPKIREEECRKSAEFIGVERLFFGGMEDTKIKNDVKTIMVIERIIDQVQPNIIYSHSYNAIHQDHRNTAYSTLSAGRRCKKILMYESPRTLKDFSPQVYVDIEEEFEQKKKILIFFSSQSNKEWGVNRSKSIFAFEGLAAYRGYQAGVRWAEAFEVGKLVIDNKEVVFY